MTNYTLNEIVISLLVIAGLFLLMRAIMLWYWKVNKIVALLERIAEGIAPKTEGIEPGAEDTEEKPRKDPPILPGRV
jgi:hypothetical protein